MALLERWRPASAPHMVMMDASALLGVPPTHNHRALGQHHAAFEKVSEKQPLAISDLPLTGEATMSV